MQEQTSETFEIFEFYARCASGFEPLLAQELKDLNIKRIRPLKGGVAFFASLKQMYRACLWLRTASRVLLVLDRVGARDADELYTRVNQMPWEKHVGLGKTLAVHAHGVNDQLRNTQFIAVKVKDAICDRLRRLRGERPDVNPKNPDVQIDVAVRYDKATISINVSGQPLHRRGYREDGVQAQAPLKETLAASIVLFSGWKEVIAQGGMFADPMCGSGTLAIEAAMIAADMAPGITRSEWGFDGWVKHDEDLWNQVLEEADERMEAGLATLPRIVAGDIDPEMVEMARANAKRAGLSQHIEFYVDDASKLSKHLLYEGKIPKRGLVATNPPYGQCLLETDQLPEVYEALASGCEKIESGWNLAVITPDDAIDTALGLVPEKTNPLFNGAIETLLRVYRIERGKRLQILVETAFGHSCKVHVAEENTTQFADRLRKVARERSKWAKKTGVRCYRVYDADLPDYSVAVDLYYGAGPDEGKLFARVTEYAPPATIDPMRAQRRFHDAVAVVATYFELPQERVFSKTRRHAKGGGQYQDARGESFVAYTEEAGFQFEVDMGGYLDTGIFLDHRDTRCMVGEMAKDKRFLNLFAYTGTATVHAAAGGAASTTTVDMSQTYLNWARRNMERNGFFGMQHRYCRADATSWVFEEAKGPNRYDLIFCDPPTFSNSKTMGERTWAIQRDHAKLICALGRILSPEGILVFSCNLRNFKIDTERLAQEHLEVEDITARTIPHDFERNPKIHHCFLIKRGADYVEPEPKPEKERDERRRDGKRTGFNDKGDSRRDFGDRGHGNRKDGERGRGKREGDRRNGNGTWDKREGSRRNDKEGFRGKDGGFRKGEGKQFGERSGGYRGDRDGFKCEDGRRHDAFRSGKGDSGFAAGKGKRSFDGRSKGASFGKRDGGFSGNRGASRGGNFGNHHGKRPGSPRG